MHALFHNRTVIIPQPILITHIHISLVFGRYRSLGMITVLKWKKACIYLVITYLSIEWKRTKFTSHTDTKLIWLRVIDIGWGMITVLIWKKSCINLFIERLDIVLSDFCPDICQWADIAVALPVFTYGQHWRYYL